jgi:translocator assembly and maintenance protein 41
MMKYGVVSTASLRADLRNWNWVYLAGRLHKPVRVLRGDGHVGLREDSESNLRAALATAVLMLPQSFDEQTLYEVWPHIVYCSFLPSFQHSLHHRAQTVVSLSYAGDVRMGVGESTSKMRNIVSPNLEVFRDLYAPHLCHLRQEGFIGCLSKEGTSRRFKHNATDGDLRHRLIGELPSVLKSAVQTRHAGASDLPSGLVIQAALCALVRRSSAAQTAKGILTAGFAKSAQYATSKIFRAQGLRLS